MLATNLESMLQAQLTLERTNEAWYQNLASAAEMVNHPGAAAYFEKSAGDEHEHAKRVRGYLIDRGEQAVFGSLPDLMEVNGEDYANLFRLALVREQITTAALKALWQAACMEDEDAQTLAFLTIPDGDFPGFLAEQTLSEREITDFLSKINRLSEDGIEVLDQALEEKYG